MPGLGETLLIIPLDRALFNSFGLSLVFVSPFHLSKLVPSKLVVMDVKTQHTSQHLILHVCFCNRSFSNHTISDPSPPNHTTPPKLFFFRLQLV